MPLTIVFWFDINDPVYCLLRIICVAWHVSNLQRAFKVASKAWLLGLGIVSKGKIWLAVGIGALLISRIFA